MSNKASVPDDGPEQIPDDRTFRDLNGRILSVVIDDDQLRYSEEQSTVDRVVFERDHHDLVDPEPEDRPRVVLLNSNYARWTAHYYPEGISTVTNAIGLSKDEKRIIEGELHLYADDSPDVVIEYLERAESKEVATDGGHVRTSDEDLAAHDHASDLEAALDYVMAAARRARDGPVADDAVARLQLAECGTRLAFYATSDETRTVGLHDATEHLEAAIETVEAETVTHPARHALQLFAGQQDGDSR